MKISDKVNKADDSLMVYMYDNGYMVEVSGRDADDEWATAKVLANNVEDMLELVREATTLPRS